MYRRQSTYRGKEPTTADVWFRKLNTKFHPLPPESQMSLAISIKEGRQAERKIKKLGRKGKAKKDKIKELQRLKKKGEDSQKDLVLYNTRFAVWFVNQSRIKGLRHKIGLELMDLIQEANLGLVKAASKFDPDYGIKFTTYAYWWVNQCVLGHIKQNSSIHVPDSAFAWLSASGAALEFMEQHKQEPTDKERIKLTQKHKKAAQLVEKMLEDEKEVGRVEQKRDKLRNALRNATSVRSLQEELSDDGWSLEQRVGVGSEEDFVHALFLREMVEVLVEQTKILDTRERTVLYTNYYLGAKLNEIGEELGLTRERVRQIRARALEKIRVKAKVKGLTEEYGETIPGTEQRGTFVGNAKGRQRILTKRKDKIAFVERQGVPGDIFSNWKFECTPIELLKEVIPAAKKEGLVEFLPLSKNLVSSYYERGAEAILERARALKNSKHAPARVASL